MADTIDLIVPDLGDFSDVEIIEVMVQPGDAVAVEDPLISLETDKAVMDVPSTAAGVIAAVSVSVGDTVSEGDVIATLNAEAPETDANELTPQAQPADTPAATGVAAEPVAPAAPESVDVTVPDIGDFEAVEIIEVHVSAGDTLAVDDPIATLETDKATMDIPSPYAGTVESVSVKVGDKVSEGNVLLQMRATLASAELAEASPAPASDATKKPDKAPPVVVAQTGVSKRAPAELPAIDEPGFARAHASPSVRRLARELGVNLIDVTPSGRKGRILHVDVKNWVKAVLTGGIELTGGGGLPEVARVDHAKFGPVEAKKLSRIQKISSQRLHASWVNLPHVTQHNLADTTDLEAWRKAHKQEALDQGVRLTPLAFIVKACTRALREFPHFNASLHENGEELVYKNYFHIGFAADTPNGLVVPVIRDADRLGIIEIARELGAMSELAREGKLKANQMQGASFTISSLGGIGGSAFTPIINAPEVAILGVSRSSMQPVWDGSDFVPRLMLPLSLSYDHRVIDGADGARFVVHLAQLLADVSALTAPEN